MQKKFLNFNLSAESLVSYWVLTYVIVILPHILLLLVDGFVAVDLKEILLSPSIVGSIYFATLIGYFLSILYFVHITLVSISVQNSKLKFNISTSKFAVLLLKGLLFSILTVGIYFPWFIKNLYSYFIDNTSYNNINYKFNSKGRQLLVIMLFSLIIPSGLIYVVAFFVWGELWYVETFSRMIVFVFQVLVSVPYFYLAFDWKINISYDTYTLKLKVNHYKSLRVIFGELILTVASIGAYFPIAMIRLYKYFVNNFQSFSENDHSILFGVNLSRESYLVIWRESFFTLISLGLYFPWAYVKINTLILNSTYYYREKNIVELVERQQIKQGGKIGKALLSVQNRYSNLRIIKKIVF